MKKHPRISIITITFNAERYLEQTLASVATQNYPALEYLIVDGGSSDRTLDIVKAHKGLVTRWISEPDDGISDAFNKGISMATGELIGIINADDYYHPGALAAVARAAVEHLDFDVYYGDAIHECFDGTGAFHFRPSRDIGRHVWRRMPISHPATFVRSSAYKRFGVFDAQWRIAMDYELILRMYKGGAKFYYIDQVLAHFRFGHSRGLSGLREVRDCAIRNGLPPVHGYYYYLTACIKSQVRRFVSKSMQK